MTKYIDTTKQEFEKPEPKKTVFNYCLGYNEKINATCNPEEFLKVLYLGRCKADGDIFAAYHENGNIMVYSGIKGDEFNG